MTRSSNAYPCEPTRSRPPPRRSRQSEASDSPCGSRQVSGSPKFSIRPLGELVEAGAQDLLHAGMEPSRRLVVQSLHVARTWGTPHRRVPSLLKLSRQLLDLVELRRVRVQAFHDLPIGLELVAQEWFARIVRRPGGSGSG